MLWNAGQDRMVGEVRDRLVEQFVTARDAALEVLVRTGQAKPKGAWHLPAYLGSESVSDRPTGSPQARDRALTLLNMQIPGIVKRGDS